MTAAFLEPSFATAYDPQVTADPIPLEEEFAITRDEANVCSTAQFSAFNTVVSLRAYGAAEVAEEAFLAARDACRYFERLFSRTLPHSDIRAITAAGGAAAEIHRETYELLALSLHYCEESRSTFDITMGACTRLWDFHEGIVPDAGALKEALRHVDFRKLELLAEDEGSARRYFARLTDPKATLDVGGTAKGYICDAIVQLLLSRGLQDFFVNLGGNVYVHGAKPEGSWTVGIKNPKDVNAVLGAVQPENMALVTSGTYERAFVQGGVTYHHILSTKTGYPVDTDVAGVTVLAPRATDAEGYSTTLLALGIEEGIAFVQDHPEITQAIFVDRENRVLVARG